MFTPLGLTNITKEEMYEFIEDIYHEIIVMIKLNLTFPYLNLVNIKAFSLKIELKSVQCYIVLDLKLKSQSLSSYITKRKKFNFKICLKILK